MRYSSLVALLVAFGAFLMTAATPVPAQDEKAGEPEPKAPYTERVTFRWWSAPDGRFNNPTRVEAYRKEVQGVQKFYLRRTGAVGGLPPVGSEIIDKDDVTWVVAKATPADVYICEVARKPTPKKKATKKG